MTDEERLRCESCGDLFEFSEARRRAFDALGFSEPPRRCPSCRKADRRAARVAARTDLIELDGRAWFCAVCAMTPRPPAPVRLISYR